jgi:hypothetical protein
VATLWPYPGDRAYFRALALLSGICATTVFAIEAYAIWFVVFANDMRERDKYGILGEYSFRHNTSSTHSASLLHHTQQRQQQASGLPQRPPPVAHMLGGLRLERCNLHLRASGPV